MAAKRNATIGRGPVDPADALTWPSDPATVRRVVIALREEAAELRRQAFHDDLTGLANRALFDDRLESTLRTAERSGDPCGVLLIDLDGFKQINDTQGHAAGDAVLREVAARLRIALRKQDTAARIGGDEFAAVLPNTTTEGAIRACRRVTKALRVGASIGIAVFPDDGGTAEELLAHADRAMYRAKRAGGGYVVFTPGADVTVHGKARRRTPFRRRGLIGFAAALAILSGAMTPTGQRSPESASVARLHAVAAVVEAATFDQVDEVVASVELAVGEIPLKEVGGRPVAEALGVLEEALGSLEVPSPTPLGDRVKRLITTIHQAAVLPAVDELPLAEPEVAVPPVGKAP